MRTIEQIIERFPGTTPVDWHQHPNGGGWVQKSCVVAEGVFVGPDVIIGGAYGIKGNVRILDRVIFAGGQGEIDGSSGCVLISGDVVINCTLLRVLAEDVKITHYARLTGIVTITEKVLVCMAAQISGDVYLGNNAVVGGTACVGGLTQLGGNVSVGGDVVLRQGANLRSGEITRSSDVIFLHGLVPCGLTINLVSNTIVNEYDWEVPLSDLYSMDAEHLLNYFESMSADHDAIKRVHDVVQIIKTIATMPKSHHALYGETE
jgi:NDP-sugar pyrophosphorylase family protein